MKRHQSVSLTIVLLLFACACFSIADFDPVVATGAEALKEKFRVFLTGLAECAGTPEAAYLEHTTFYAEAREELDRLEAQARLQPDNELTLRSLDHIRDNVAELEEIHRLGISRGEVEIIAQLFDTQFRMLADLENAKQRKEP